MCVERLIPCVIELLIIHLLAFKKNIKSFKINI